MLPPQASLDRRSPRRCAEAAGFFLPLALTPRARSDFIPLPDPAAVAETSRAVVLSGSVDRCSGDCRSGGGGGVGGAVFDVVPRTSLGAEELRSAFNGSRAGTAAGLERRRSDACNCQRVSCGCEVAQSGHGKRGLLW